MTMLSHQLILFFPDGSGIFQDNNVKINQARPPLHVAWTLTMMFLCSRHTDNQTGGVVAIVGLALRILGRRTREVVPVGTVTTWAIIDILDSLFVRWGLSLSTTMDNGVI